MFWKFKQLNLTEYEDVLWQLHRINALMRRVVSIIYVGINTNVVFNHRLNT